MAGVTALTWNVDATFTGEEIMDAIKATATKRSSGDLVINPVGMIEMLEKRIQSKTPTQR